MKNYYEILQVKNFAEIEVIKASYKALSKKYHPDLNKGIDPSKMVEINNAYDVLGNPYEKEKYDKTLRDVMLEKEGKHQSSTENNTKSYCQDDFTEDYENNKNLIFRVPLSILISTCIGISTSYIIQGIISTDGSWSFIIYLFLGGLVGFLIKNISGIEKQWLAYIGVLITIFCLVYPFYEYAYNNMPLLSMRLSKIELFLHTLKQITTTLLGNGFIRMIFVLLSPYIAFITICEDI